jgi:hypothetical protein
VLVLLSPKSHVNVLHVAFDCPLKFTQNGAQPAVALATAVTVGPALTFTVTVVVATGVPQLSLTVTV